MEAFQKFPWRFAAGRWHQPLSSILAPRCGRQLGHKIDENGRTKPCAVVEHHISGTGESLSVCMVYDW
jgi:hypothetical protein